ncbi:MAG TPA: hypothetical protein PKV72_00260 [Candidatus Peribacteria bacterium]|nr:hypothetical protein [Candidatus Peribacteria bacterium]
MNIGIASRNFVGWAFCIAIAAGVVTPSVYVTTMSVVAEQNSKTPLFGNPVTAVVIANAVIVVGIAVILTLGWLMARIPSLWTISALVMALPAIHLTTKLATLPEKVVTAWQPLAAAPDWVWWTAFGVSLAFYLFCGPFGKSEPQEPQPEPLPAPAKKK